MFRFSKKNKKDGNQKKHSINPTIESIINNSMIQASHQTAHSQIQAIDDKFDQLQVDHASPDQAQEQAHKPGKSWISSNESIGQQRDFNKVCDFLRQCDVGMVGIYGMGGVGKTTLMKKISNEFLKPSNFDVILIVVSKTVDVNGIQKQIMRGLNLNFPEDDDIQARAMVINNAVVNYLGNLAILLDDIWEYLELEEVGILGGNELDTSTFKVMFTTRSEDVCLQMNPDQNLKVDCLGWDESWTLFSRSVGEKTLNSHYRILDLAKEVAKECAGLPLALTIIGKAMVSKTSPGAWEDALFNLQKSPSKVLGVEKKMFEKLKFSFDNLPDQLERDCFLFCCLFPEDEVIAREVLIEYWIGEGLLDIDDGYQEACNRGDAVIDSLLSKSLLEKDVTHRVGKDLKLHDVVRDMGLWIASGLNLSIRCSVHKLKNELLAEKCVAAKRVYVLANSELDDLLFSSNLSTMFLVGENSFRYSEYSPKFSYKMSNSFLLSLEKVKLLSTDHVEYLEKQPSNLGMLLGLRYLEIKRSNLTTLPLEVGNLTHLLVLKLVDNKSLRQLTPTIGQLTELRKLYIYDSRITELNSELRNLTKLEILVIENYLNLEIRVISSVIFQNLANLRILQLRAIYHMRIVPKKLWTMNRLEKLVMIISSFKRVVESSSIDGEMTEEGEILTCLRQLSSLRYLWMVEWPIDKFVMPPNCASICLSHLNELYISSCKRLEAIEFGEAQLPNLCHLGIYSCPALKYITGLQHLHRLQQLGISYCDNLEEENGSLLPDAQPLCFPHLKTLELVHLKIKSICSDSISFPSLSRFSSLNSLCLKKLPRGLMNKNKPLDGKIGGTLEWWEAIQWQDDEFKSYLSPLFQERPW